MPEFPMPDETSSSHPFTFAEKRVFDSIADVMGEIQDLDTRGQLKHNLEELAKAVHVLQQFPIQHMLNRVWPEEFSDWYKQ